MKEKIKNLLDLNKKYLISTNASSIAFYMILSLSSFVILLIGLLLTSNLFSSFLSARLISMFGIAVEGLVSEMFTLLSLSKYSFLLVISAIFYSSSVLTQIRFFSLDVYKEYPKDGYIHTHLYSLLVYVVLLCLIIFLLVINFYSSYFFINILKINELFYRIYVFLSELSIYYLIVMILYLYLPPKKMKIKEVWKVSLFVTLVIYLCILILKLVADILISKGIVLQVVYIISTAGFIVYFVLIVILYGIVKIYHQSID